MHNLNGGESPAYTLMEACELARIPRPVSAKDVQRTALRLSQEGIRTNLDCPENNCGLCGKKPRNHFAGGRCAPAPAPSGVLTREEYRETLRKAEDAAHDFGTLTNVNDHRHTVRLWNHDAALRAEVERWKDENHAGCEILLQIEKADEERFWRDAITAERWANLALCHQLPLGTPHYAGPVPVSQLPAFTEPEIDQALNSLTED